MNVYEFIREKTEDIQENAAEFRAKLEPRFRNWSNTINDKITNTLNNPWITNLNPFDKKVTRSSEAVITNKVTEKVYKELKEKLGKEIWKCGANAEHVLDKLGKKHVGNMLPDSPNTRNQPP